MSRSSALRLTLPSLSRTSTTAPLSPSPSLPPSPSPPPAVTLRSSSLHPPHPHPSDPAPPLSPLSSGLPSPTFPSRPPSPFPPPRPISPALAVPTSISLKHNDSSSRSRRLSLPPTNTYPSSPGTSTVEDILCPGDRLGEGITLLGEDIHAVPLDRPPRPDADEEEDVADVLEVIGKIAEGSNACVYLVREVLGDAATLRPPRALSENEEEDVLGRLEFDSPPPTRQRQRHRSRPPPVSYGRHFAVKLLSKRDLSPAQIQMQLVEAQIHQSIPAHPNIVSLHRTLETQSWLLLVMEHVPGEDLFYFLEQARDHVPGVPSPTSSSSPSFLLSPSPSSSSSSHTLHPSLASPSQTRSHRHQHQSQPISQTPRTPSLLGTHSPTSLLSPSRLRLIARMFSQMCASVQACHASGIAHRDIKPENFIVTDGVNSEEGLRGERRVVVKLTDFGLASREEVSKDVDCGSAPYMSYECANNVAPTYATHPADVWSLGIVLINMLYHQNPWTRATPTECGAYAAFLEAPVQFFIDRFPGITREMATWLVDHVFCEPEDRVSAGELGEWVEGLGGMVDESGGVGLLRRGSRARKVRQERARDGERARERRERRSEGGRERRPREHRSREHRERSREPGALDHEHEHAPGDPTPPSSRDPSLMKKRKRGARSNKSKNSAATSSVSLDNLHAHAQAQALPGQDGEAPPDTLVAEAVQALVREISTFGRSGRQSRAGSVVPPDEPVPPLPVPVPGAVPGSSSPAKSSPPDPASQPQSLRTRPSIEDEVWKRGLPLPLPLPLPSSPHSPPGPPGARWRQHAASPLNPNPYPPNTGASSSVSSFSGASASTSGWESWRNSGGSNGSVRSFSTFATTASDPMSLRSKGWPGGKEGSVRSLGSLESGRSVGSSSVGSGVGVGGKGKRVAGTGGTNVKRMDGLPQELNMAPRTPFRATKAEKRPPPPDSPTPTRLDPIAERERSSSHLSARARPGLPPSSISGSSSSSTGTPTASAATAPPPTTQVFSRKNASTSTTSLPLNDEERGGEKEEGGKGKRAERNKMQSNTLGKLLSGLRPR